MTPLPRLVVLVAGALAGLLAPRPALAQRLDLDITPAVIVFPSMDPDVSPVITAAPVNVRYRVRQYNGPWVITILASGDLISGGSTVDISNVSWTASPSPPFLSGTLNKTVAQVLASGVGNVNPTATGAITFRLRNSWTYETGMYTQTLVLTLSTP